MRKITLFLFCLLVFSRLAGQNCTFGVATEVTKISDCEKNGIITAKITGSDFENGYIDIKDAKYSIASVTSGGFTTIPDNNGGVLQGIPPGTYTVTVQAFCTKTQNWVSFTSGTITMTGTYPGFDTNKIYVETAGVQKSLECSPTGLIPIRLGSGRPPYSVKIRKAPDPELIDSVLTYPTEGLLEIKDIPWGDYEFVVSDNCGYQYVLDPKLGKIEPEYRVEKVEDTPSCVDNGIIHISLRNGTLPYTIRFTEMPETYTGEDTLYVDRDYVDNPYYVIDGLPAGDYKFTINDVCHPQDFEVTIKEGKPSATLTQHLSSVPCSAEGEISFTLSGGNAPYIIKTVECPGDCPFESISVSKSGDTIITGMFPGNYRFEITDKCGEYTVEEGVSVDTMEMTLTASATRTSKCYLNDGTATVNVAGGAAPFAVSMTDTVTGAAIALPSGPPYEFKDLTCGVYKFTVTDKCNRSDSVLVVVERTPLEAGITPEMMSLDCFGTGIFVLNIREGDPDFTVIVRDSITGDSITAMGPQEETDFTFGGLQPGKYMLQIIDACDTLVEYVAIDTIKELERYPDMTNIAVADLYENIFYPLETADEDCKEMLVKRELDDLGTHFEHLWRKHPELFQVAFVPSDNPASPWDWRDVSDSVVAFNSTYCKAREDELYFTAYIRFKSEEGGDDVPCDTVRHRDPIRFKPNGVAIGVSNNVCAGFSLNISPDPGNILCLPYTMFVIDESKTPHDTVRKSVFNNLDPQTLSGIPHGEYKISFRDSEDCEWFSGDVSAPIPPPELSGNAINISKYDFDCDTYSMRFEHTFNNICYPYIVVLTEEATPKEVIKMWEFADVPPPLSGSGSAEGLTYLKKYQLCMSQIVGKDTLEILCQPFEQAERDPMNNYDIKPFQSYCLPDTAKGYIRLFRNGEPNSFYAGSVIEFLDGPATPIHVLDTITETGITQFFPFSVDSLQPELVDIPEGVYRFKITDHCNWSREIEIDYKRSSLKDFRYDSVGGCVGMDIYPKGSIYLGDEKVKSYFRIIETPPGIAEMPNSITEGQSFPLTETGRYVLRISAYSEYNGCPFDTLAINFVKQTPALDADSTRTYICEEGSDGYIRVKSKGGVGPFTYELFDKGVRIDQNSTGVFNYGKYGETYRVEIYDETCRVLFPTDVHMLNLSKERLISDNIIACKGDEIILKCISIGSYSGYNWTGPNEWESHLQNPVLTNVTQNDSGQYSITVHPEGCMREITQHVDVTVIDPLPLPDTTVFYCVDDPAVPLSAIPDEGNYLKWYDTDTLTHLPSAPVPPTDKADTIEYFVAQVNSMLGCEGAKSAFRIIVQDFPDTVAFAFADDICKNGFPIAVIPETFTDYVYRLYDANNAVVGIDTASADTLRILSEASFSESGLLYVEVETNHRCVSRQKSKVPVRVVHPAAPAVYDTLYCLNAETAIPLRADSTGGHRLQWYGVDTVPVPSAPVPATDVVGVFSYFVAQVDTLLGCEGDKSELKVTIEELPDTLINAHAPDICRNTQPVVTVGQTYNLYTYTLFDRNNDTLYSAVATGSPLDLYSPETLSDSDTLFVEIQNQHQCTSKDRSIVPVRVEIPDVPEVRDTMYCLDESAVALNAVAAEGYAILWHDLEGNPVGSAPVPPTDRADTLYYNVTQKHATLGCESDTVRIQVIVMDLPDTVAFAFADDICKDGFPTAIIPETFTDYVYRLYDANNAVVGIDTASADTLRILSEASFSESGLLYVEVETNHRCVSRQKSKVPVRVVHPASPAVYDTLYCLNGEAIPLRADSTGGHRLQWYGVDTVPVPSAPVPATDAVGVFSYFVAQVDTLLGCEGDKSELKVTIEELPDTLINAHAPDICRNTQPVVTVGQTYDLYTYTLFNRNNDTLYSTVATGSPLDLYSSETLSGSDTLFVEIQNQHQCTSKDRSIVPVRVEIPDVPEAMDTTYCMGESAAALYAVAAEGYAIQWHDLEGNPVGSAPVPPTDRVDTLYYNVTQKHATLGCESDTVRVRVIVTALPDTVVAVSPDICPGRNPVIEIEASDEGYIYNVYSASNALMVTAVGSGDSLLVTVPETIYETAYYYVETVNLRGCASDKKARVETVVLNYMYLMPDKIPQYQRDKLYSVQLETNAVSPYEIYTEDVLPFGFSLSPTGLISGVAPRNGLIDPVPFTVKVSDVNGCFAEKEYVLESHLFIPQAFTPNGDGHNDVFMKGRRLVIFDRLGLKIYEGDNGWDGSRLDGAPAPPDTYFYLIYYEDENLKTEGRKKGYITLIRRK